MSKPTAKWHTQEHMGRFSLIDRLTAQVGGDREKALHILLKRGDVNEYGELTDKGRKRDSMTAAERAIDRASKEKKRSPMAFKYNAKTNRARFKWQR